MLDSLGVGVVLELKKNKLKKFLIEAEATNMLKAKRGKLKIPQG